MLVAADLVADTVIGRPHSGTLPGDRGSKDRNLQDGKGNHHYVEDNKLVSSVRRAVDEHERDRVEAAVRRYLEKQPSEPDLVGATVAARILKVFPPHITRLKSQGRMPTPIPIEGSVDVYLRSDVMALAKELDRERGARAARKRAAS